MNIHSAILCQPIPVAASPKAWIGGRSIAGIAVSNLAGVIDVSLS
jgi:hypothetical protein